jgi:hypothetical protein
VGHQVLAKSKQDQDALYLMGLCHYALGEPVPALGYLERFLATRPEVEVVYEVEGLIKLLRGEAQAMDPDPARDQND